MEGKLQSHTASKTEKLEARLLALSVTRRESYRENC